MFLENDCLMFPVAYALETSNNFIGHLLTLDFSKNLSE